MSAKLKVATAVIGGALTALAIPTADAQAATPPPRPGLADPSAEPTAPQEVPAGHPKAPGSANAATSCGGSITWQDRYDNRYLEIYHSGKAPGNWADAYPGNGTCTQHWFAIASGSSSYFTAGYYRTADYGMVNANSYLCLAAPTTNIGNTHVVQEPCGYSTYSDLWKEVSDTGGWTLIEVQYDNSYAGSPARMVAACEDIANHWIYTSTIYNVGRATNCIWH